MKQHDLEQRCMSVCKPGIEITSSSCNDLFLDSDIVHIPHTEAEIEE